MRRRQWIVVVAAVVLFGVVPILAGCESADGSAQRILKVTAADAGKPVTLENGQTLEVTLESNKTTGFGWQVARESGVLQAEGEPAYDAPSTGVVGAGGRETFTFTAVRPGKGTLRLEYRRPWEKDVPAEKTIEFPVDVR